MEQPGTIRRLRQRLARALAEREDAERYIARIHRMIPRRSGGKPPRRRLDDLFRRAAEIIETAIPQADDELRADLEGFAERLRAEAGGRSEAREVALRLVLPDPT